MEWSETTKDTVRKVLTPQCMSSDESDFTDEGGQQVVKAYLVKKLPQELSALKGAKEQLDRVHL